MYAVWCDCVPVSHSESVLCTGDDPPSLCMQFSFIQQLTYKMKTTTTARRRWKLRTDNHFYPTFNIFQFSDIYYYVARVARENDIRSQVILIHCDCILFRFRFAKVFGNFNMFFCSKVRHRKFKVLRKNFCYFWYYI